MSKGLPKLLSLPVDDGGCGWYRVRQIFAKMSEMDLAITHVVDEKKDGTAIEELTDNADAIVCRNEMSHARMMEIIREKDPKKRMVFDHDDNTYLVKPSNAHYKDHGTKEYIDEETGAELWINGREGFDMYRNRKAIIDMEYLLEQSTMNTAPTERLAAMWGMYNGNSKMIPNCINFDWYPDVSVVDKSKGDGIRVGWQGGMSHAGDFREVGPEVAKVMKSNKNVVYYSIGAFWDYFFKGVEDRCKVFPWTSFRAHPYRMKVFDLDVGIIPLQDIDFNYFKSEIKFSEFAALRVPCLVKDQEPYSPFIKDGVNCLTYKTTDEFNEKLTELVNNKDLRKKISDTAYKWVHDTRDLNKWAPKMLDIYLNG